jgi:hypothetical protein
MEDFSELEYFRQRGDAPADELMRLLYERYQSKLGGILMPFLHDFVKTNLSNLDPEIQDFFKTYAVLPSFYNPKFTIRATDFYLTHQQTIGVVLGCYSLPYCYLGADGAKVLGFSGRIKSDTYNRLKETGQFLRRTMNYDHWESGEVLNMLVKIRLLHAFWRIMILKSGKWDLKWGVPVNQEDMAGTNLAFSLIVLRGLRKLGFDIDKAYEDAYLIHWAVVGTVMGIEDPLAVTEIKMASKLDKSISKRQFRSSIEGTELTNSLLNTYIKMAGSNLAGEYFKNQSRIMMGDAYADMLGIPKSNFPISILNAFNKTSSFLSNIYA